MASQLIFDAMSNYLSPDTLKAMVADSRPPTPTPSTVLDSTSANTTSPPAFETHLPPNTSLFGLLFSLAIKNQDILKLVVIGGLIETFRRLSDYLWNWLVNIWFVTAEFDNNDDTFQWMMVWLAKQPFWAKAREVQISSASWGKTYHKGIDIPDVDGTKEGDTGFQTKRQLSYLPAFEKIHWLRYKGTWISVMRTRSQNKDMWTGRVSETLQVSLLTRNPKILRSLLLDAKRLYRAEDEDVVEIYAANQYDDWSRSATRKKRPLKSIILEPEIKDMVLNDAKEYLQTEQWYTDRGIPYRRGYLLHGVPGSGKTSLIHSIAGELGLDIYVVSIAKKGLDDSSLQNFISLIPSRSIILMEDLDAALRRTVVMRESEGDADSEASSSAAPKTPGPAKPADEPKTGVTLSGLLNALDGVAAQEGRILFATTNKYEALDEALCRPGRMDVHVEFKHASQWQAKELFRCFFSPSLPEMDLAATATATAAAAAASEKAEARALTQDEVDALAERFSAAIPDRQFSMASLQGHLMRFKTRPNEAVEAVQTWIETESRKRGTGAKDVKSTLPKLAS